MTWDQQSYHRYHIETKMAPALVSHPHRFRVEVNRFALAKLLIKEVLHYGSHYEVVLSRPCVYGVFSGPIGGFAPRESLCVGCLRCTVQYPEMVTISPHPAREKLGDEFFNPDYVDTCVYEAETGRVPIRGAGYRGKFGGEGWDGMWTDMSEIVRPTRDGIHGREFISTVVDLGYKPPFLKLNSENLPIDQIPKTISIPIPLLFDVLPSCQQFHHELCLILSEAAKQLEVFAVLPIESILKFALKNPHIIPLISDADSLKNLEFQPKMIEMEVCDESIFQAISSHFPQAIIIARVEDAQDLMPFYRTGVRVFHLAANYHGKTKEGTFIQDFIRKSHDVFVKENCRNEISLIGSGGMIAAEHLAKGILCGLDAVALDTPSLVALQAQFSGTCLDRASSEFYFKKSPPVGWGVQRLKNLASSWHNQLLEIMGAMGIREVRRLRGEMGRVMLQKDLEREAFSGIAGYEIR